MDDLEKQMSGVLPAPVPTKIAEGTTIGKPRDRSTQDGILGIAEQKRNAIRGETGLDIFAVPHAYNAPDAREIFRAEQEILESRGEPSSAAGAWLQAIASTLEGVAHAGPIRIQGDANQLDTNPYLRTYLTQAIWYARQQTKQDSIQPNQNTSNFAAFDVGNKEVHVYSKWLSLIHI